MCTYTNTVKLGPLTGLEIASYFPCFLVENEFSPLAQSPSFQIFLSFVSTGGRFQLFANPSRWSCVFVFIPAAPCLTLRHHFPHPGSWRSLPRLAPRWSSS